MEIGGKSMVALVVERLQRVKNIDRIVLLTSCDKSNDPLMKEAQNLRIGCFRGSEENVLDRFYGAAKKFLPDNIIRVTADCPLIDPELISRALEVFLKGDYDILSNNRIWTFPHGFNFEIFKAKAQERSWKAQLESFGGDEAKFQEVFVNPTAYMLENDTKFKNKDLVQEEDLSHIRLTVDYQEDIDVIKIIYENLYQKGRYFPTKEILDFLKENPQVLNINKKYVTKHSNRQ